MLQPAELIPVPKRADDALIAGTTERVDPQLTLMSTWRHSRSYISLPCGQRIKRLGSNTSASRRAVHDSKRSWAWVLALRLEREEEEIALTLMVAFAMKVLDEFAQRSA
jgi:hypothetical protein